MQIPQVSKADVTKFSKVWTHKGIAIFLDDVHIQFATDFANIMLKNLFAQMAVQAREDAKPKVILAEG